MAQQEPLRIQYTLGSTTPHSVGMWVSITFIIYGTVLFNTPDLKISNDNGHVYRTSFSGHAQSIPTNRHAHMNYRA